MFKSYLAAALRSLARNKSQALINIFGLATGFAAAILIALFVRHELTYDQFVSGHERVFRLSEIYNRPGTSPLSIDATLPKLAALLKSDFPEIDYIARLQMDDGAIRIDHIEANETITWADPDFFKVFPLPIVAGDVNDSLAKPDSVVLTRSVAEKYFGSHDVLGRTLELNGHPVRVGAVIEDLPSNSHLVLRLLASSRAAFSRLASLDRDGLEIDSPLTYFRLKTGTSIEQMREALPDFIRRHGIKQIDAPPGKKAFELKITPISEIHLQPAGLGAIKPATSRASLAAFVAIAALIVLVAVINYVNLITALSNRRSIEIGVRKAAGATGRELIVQFIGESTLFVVLAATVSIGLVELALPYFNAYNNTTISFEYWRPGVLAAILTAVACLGAAAGLYPALILSSFGAATVLKGKGAFRPPSGAVRIGLVIVQFSILIGMTLAALTIYRQTRFALYETLRVPANEILQIRNGCEDTLQEQVAAIEGVQAAACSSAGMLSDTLAMGKAGTALTFRDSRVDYGYLELYGLRPLAGRFFDHAQGSDEMNAVSGVVSNVVINETALRQLGYTRPEEAIGSTLKWRKFQFTAPSEQGRDAVPIESVIVGVVADFSLDGMRNKVEPQIYNIDRLHFDSLHVRLNGKHLPESMAAIDRLWSRLHPGQPIARTFLNQTIQARYSDVIRQGGMLTAFTALALLLACMGLYGLAAFTAQRRTKEIGIRKAMGARNGDVMRLLLWQFALPVLWANLIAWPLAGYFMSRWLGGFAYHIDLEPWLFLAATAAALLVALLTVSTHCYLVARARPVHALRYE